MAEPLLTIGDLEPERPTVAIARTEPADRWQRLKARHFDLLLRWFPVRTERRRDLYPLRHPSEFGMRTLAQISAAQKEITDLQSGDLDDAGAQRVERLLRKVSGLVLDAPSDVLDLLSGSEHIQVLMAFTASAMGKLPTPISPENPLTSDASSPASAGSTPASAGMSG